jgi:TonB family protein
MRRLKVVVLIALILTLSSLTLLGKHRGQKNFVDWMGYETAVRVQASTVVMPTYPEEARAVGAQGLVDSAVVFDEYGNLKRIKILESPHPAISKAVENAVKQWKVKVIVTSEGPLRLFGELRFHFVIKNGVASVENPSREEWEIRSKAFQKVMRQEAARPRN